MDIVYMPFKKIFSYGFNTNGTLYDTAVFTLFPSIYESFHCILSCTFATFIDYSLI